MVVAVVGGNGGGCGRWQWWVANGGWQWWVAMAGGILWLSGRFADFHFRTTLYITCALSDCRIFVPLPSVACDESPPFCIM
jgi:hypothetical protein